MLCPKCSKGEIKEIIVFEGILFNRKKKIINYCPLCDFKNEHIFRINEDTYQERK